MLNSFYNFIFIKKISLILIILLICSLITISFILLTDRYNDKSVINFVLKPNLYPSDFQQEHGFKIKINSFPYLRHIGILEFPENRKLLLKAQSEIHKYKDSKSLNIINYKINLDAITPQIDIWIEHKDENDGIISEKELSEYKQAIFKILAKENIGHLEYYNIALEEYQNVLDSINLLLKSRKELPIKYPDKCINLNDINKSIAELSDCYEIYITNQEIEFLNLDNKIEMLKSNHKLNNLKFIMNVTQERYNYFKKNSFYNLSMKKILDKNEQQTSFYTFIIFINLLTTMVVIILYFLYWQLRKNKFEKSL